MTWEKPLRIRNAGKDELVDFILSMMAEDDADQRFTDWALSPEQIGKLIAEMMEVQG